MCRNVADNSQVKCYKCNMDVPSPQNGNSIVVNSVLRAPFLFGTHTKLLTAGETLMLNGKIAILMLKLLSE